MAGVTRTVLDALRTEMGESSMAAAGRGLGRSTARAGTTGFLAVPQTEPEPVPQDFAAAASRGGADVLCSEGGARVVASSKPFPTVGTLVQARCCRRRRGAWPGRASPPPASGDGGPTRRGRAPGRPCARGGRGNVGGARRPVRKRAGAGWRRAAEEDAEVLGMQAALAKARRDFRRAALVPWLA